MYFKCSNSNLMQHLKVFIYFLLKKIKQALGLPFLNFSGRSDTKMYQLLYGQHPISSTRMYSESDLSSYPCGTNAIVAVISYSVSIQVFKLYVLLH